MLTVFVVHLNCFYTHLNAIAIENLPLSIVFKILAFPEVINSSHDFSIDITGLGVILKLTVFSVNLNGFYTHLREDCNHTVDRPHSQQRYH